MLWHHCTLTNVYLLLKISWWVWFSTNEYVCLFSTAHSNPKTVLLMVHWKYHSDTITNSPLPRLECIWVHLDHSCKMGLVPLRNYRNSLLCWNFYGLPSSLLPCEQLLLHTMPKYKCNAVCFQSGEYFVFSVSLDILNHVCSVQDVVYHLGLWCLGWFTAAGRERYEKCLMVKYDTGTPVAEDLCRTCGFKFVKEGRRLSRC